MVLIDTINRIGYEDVVEEEDDDVLHFACLPFRWI
jgi:hypothetical protein